MITTTKNKKLYDEFDRINKITIPNIIIHGPNHSGKNRLCKYILHLYDSDDVINERIYLGNYLSKKDYSVSINRSNMFIEFKSQGLSVDIYIIQKILNAYILNGFIFDTKYKFKFIIVKNAENLNLNTQQSLRCIIERYYKICRFIFISNDISNMITPILSRCNTYKISNPSKIDLIIQYYVYKNIHINNISYDNIIKEFISNNIKNYNDLYWYVSFKDEIELYGQKKHYEIVLDNLIKIVNTIHTINTKYNMNNSIYNIRKYLYCLYILPIKYDVIIDYILKTYMTLYQNNRDKLLKITEILCNYTIYFNKTTKYPIILESIFMSIVKINL